MIIKILLAEQSAFQRNLIQKILSAHNDLEVIIAKKSNEILDIAEQEGPDILLLDLELPNEEDLLTYKLIVEQYPAPTIILSEKSIDEMDFYSKSIVLKSFDFILKPKGLWETELPKIETALISKIRMASKILPRRMDVTLLNREEIKLKEEKLEIKHKPETKNQDDDRYPSFQSDEKKLKKYVLDTLKIPIIEKLKTNIIVMGASVGGPQTIRSILSELPSTLPSPILIVQHMNDFFIRQMVVSLRSVCALPVKIPKNGETVLPGIIYVSPGGKHMELYVMNNKPTIRTFEGPLINDCRPSVDVLFLSAASVFQQHSLGILLTGMGHDGVAGLKAIKLMGGITISESEETSIIYDMPKIAAEAKAADIIIPNYEISKKIVEFARKL